MKISQALAAATGCVALVSGLFVDSVRADSTPATPISSTTSTAPIPKDALAIHAAGEAALVMMCENGIRDQNGRVTYQTTAAAQPTLARSISADCSLVS